MLYTYLCLNSEDNYQANNNSDEFSISIKLIINGLKQTLKDLRHFQTKDHPYPNDHIPRTFATHIILPILMSVGVFSPFEEIEKPNFVSFNSNS